MASSSPNNLPALLRQRINVKDPDIVTPILGEGDSEAKVCYFRFCDPCVMNEDIFFLLALGLVFLLNSVNVIFFC